MGHGANEEPDWYEILGVAQHATQADITSAYYSLARNHHPDTSSETDPCNRRFKDIAAAYEVLSSPGRRAEYDRRAKRNCPQAVAAVKATGLDIDAELPISPEEARFGGRCEVRIDYLACCSTCAGKGAIETVPCGDCHARGRSIRSERLRVEIPRGVVSGTRLSLRGRGHQDPAAEGRHRGTLYLHIVVRPCW